MGGRLPSLWTSPYLGPIPQVGCVPPRRSPDDPLDQTALRRRPRRGRDDGARLVRGAVWSGSGGRRRARPGWQPARRHPQRHRMHRPGPGRQQQQRQHRPPDRRVAHDAGRRDRRSASVAR
ncbi:hypothetical protein PSCLAVI8L_130052 [Pseudoclavibacter sp. 8L]|nr:hypothetical protein PSCLAVI8L_130052 [Pseudoclavibacter sp. 8L]